MNLQKSIVFLTVKVEFKMLIELQRFIVNDFITFEKVQLFRSKQRSKPVALSQNYAFPIDHVVNTIK